MKHIIYWLTLAAIGLALLSYVELAIYNTSIDLEYAETISPPHFISKVKGVVTGLVAAYSFDEGSGVILSDYAGNKNFGTLTNGPSWVSGKYGTALSFDGTDDYVNVGDPQNATLDFGTGDFTISFWVNTAGYKDRGSTANIILSKSDLERTSSYQVYLGSDNLPVLGINALYSAKGRAPVADGKWHYISAVRRSGVLEIYVDGVAGKTDTNANSVSSAYPLYLGRDSTETRYFSGKLDEMRLYERALSLAEIASDMNTPVDPNTTPSPTPSPTASASPSPSTEPTPSASPVSSAPSSPVFKYADNPTVYFYQDGKKRPFPSWQIFLLHVQPSQIIILEDSKQYPDGAAMNIPEGTLVKGPLATVYLIENGKKRGFTSSAAFLNLGYKWNQVKVVGNSDLALHPDGSPIQVGN